MGYTECQLRDLNDIHFHLMVAISSPLLAQASLCRIYTIFMWTPPTEIGHQLKRNIHVLAR